MYVCMYVCVGMYECMCACMYVCMYVCLNDLLWLSHNCASPHVLDCTSLSKVLSCDRGWQDSAHEALCAEQGLVLEGEGEGGEQEPAPRN